MFRFLKFILIGVLFIGTQNSVSAQCCAAGNPDSGDDLSEGGGKNKLMLSLGYKYSYSDQYYLGTEPIDFSYIDYSDFDFMSLNVSYGITSKFKAIAEIGYFFSKSQISDYRPTKNAYGLADASLTLTYMVYKTKKHYFSFIPIVRVTFPVGKFDQQDGSVVLPIDLQPSSGSFRYAGGLVVNKKFGESNFSMNGIFNMEISQRIDTERTNYKYGNLYNISATGNYTLKNINFRLQARYQIRDRASGSSGDLINATGGQVIFLAPQVNYNFFKTWRVSVVYEQPIYKNMNGRQLTNKFMVSAKLSKTFDFNKNDTSSLFISMPENYIVTTMKISGTCGACKITIERICYDQKGVLYANWDVETKILTLKHTKKLNMDKLKKNLAKADHTEII